jgi:hypothetical protein
MSLAREVIQSGEEEGSRAGITGTDS